MLINLHIKLLLGFSHQVIVDAVVFLADLNVSLLLLPGAAVCGTSGIILVTIL